MRRGGDEAHITVIFPARRMEALDRQQPGILSLRARIRLQRHRVKARALGQPGLQVPEHRAVALRLIRRHKGVQPIHLRPAQRHHFRRRVQLHRAAPQRDHAAVQRDVLGLQSVQVAHHLRLGVVGVEDWMRQECRRTMVPRRAVQRMRGIQHRFLLRLGDAKRRQQA